MLNDLSPSESTAVLACTPDAIPPELRQRWMQSGPQVYGAIEEVQELVDGYACRLPSDATMLGIVAERVATAAGLSVAARGIWTHPSDPTLATPTPGSSET